MQERTFIRDTKRFYRTTDGDTFDQIALGFYGRTAGVTEALATANPDIMATHRGLFASGTLVHLPDLPALTTAAPVRLFS